MTPPAAPFHIPRPALLDDPALRAVLTALPAARLVGGAVRDLLAGRPVADIDLATPEPPDQVIRALAAAGLKHAPTGLQHGTVTAIAAGRGFEVTTLRRDEHTDGRHASVAWTPDWEQDAARRDFTINAMSMQPGGLVFDYFGGRDDLRAGRVRFVGDPARRIAEDYLRVLRFFRFQGRYGITQPDAATLDALQAAIPNLGRLSVERVWSELKRILAIPDPRATLDLMHALGVLPALLPGTDLPALARLIQAGAPPDPMLRLAALHPPPGTAARLRLSGPEAAALEAAAGPATDPAASGDDLRRALATTPPAALIARAWLAGSPPALHARIAAIPRPVFPLAGRDALALGIPPGPRVGELLDAVRTWWMQGGCHADAAACRAELASRAAA